MYKCKRIPSLIKRGGGKKKCQLACSEKCFPTQLFEHKTDRCSIQNNSLSMPCLINMYIQKRRNKGKRNRVISWHEETVWELLVALESGMLPIPGTGRVGPPAQSADFL